MTAALSAKPVVSRSLLLLAGALLLAGCNDRNAYQPPPPQEVAVAKPLVKAIPRYIRANGQTAATLKVDLVARVQGVLDKVGFKDGDYVKEGTTLFTIERDTYETSLKIAQAAVEQQQALLAQTELDFQRKTSLVQRQVASEATFDDSRAKRDQAAAGLKQAQGNLEQAQTNLGYTTIKAPFSGYVSARLVDPGALVGAGGPTKLATLVQTDPLFVNFTVDERQVLQVRTAMAERGLSMQSVGPVTVEIGLQTEKGYPHAGLLDYVAPDIDPGTGTLAARARFDNKSGVLIPGLFVRVRVVVQKAVEAIMVPERAIGTSQRGAYVLVVGPGDKVEQRDIEAADDAEGGLRIVTQGLKADDRVVVGGIQRAAPGSVVKPVVQAPATGSTGSSK
ncbi:MAG: efflux RND transporter periplasmic adaptor subunit [Hyphomicrobiaceae bacterium]|nr:efflux RND transporter periplasmic adaptor subunit [Hyphomicrobiaceae bacterium]